MPETMYRSGAELDSKQQESSEDQVLHGLQPYGACDVADALLRQGIKDGGFLPGFKLLTGDKSTKLIGRVYTVRFERRVDGQTPQKAFTGHYIDHVPEGAILLSSAPADTTQAIFGGLMALRLHKLGARGAVIDGRVRDLEELRGVGLPIFARDIGICAATSVVYPAALGVDVEIRGPDGEVKIVRSGEILVGDENGVAVIPGELEGQVWRLLPRLVQQDKKVREAIEQGKTAEEAFRLRSV